MKVFLGCYVVNFQNKKCLLLKTDYATQITKNINNESVKKIINKFNFNIDDIVFIAIDGFTKTTYNGRNDIISYLRDNHLDYYTIPWFPIPHFR